VSAGGRPVPCDACANCGDRTRGRQRHCGACLMARLRDGVFPTAAVRAQRQARHQVSACTTCGRAIMPVERRRGRCPPCYQHWRKYGTERPAERWGQEQAG
jgi:predicted RNA-binding Zn-ribbon protein involved in translation (DUF1610 family)